MAGHIEPSLLDAPHWGNWYLNTDKTALYNIEHGDYEFPLNELDTDAKLQARVHHVAEKNWATPTELTNLAAAIKEIRGVEISLDACLQSQKDRLRSISMSHRSDSDPVATMDDARLNAGSTPSRYPLGAAFQCPISQNN